MTTTGQEEWPGVLDAVVRDGCSRLRRVMVVGETQSTQDAAAELGLQPDEAVVAWRQTAGRGRFGRRWADTGVDGVAATFVLPKCDAPCVAIAAAIGVTHVVDDLLSQADTVASGAARCVGIKWPNDVLVDGRKIAGVLVEVRNDHVFAGVGLNVAQRDWPMELAARATSLHLLGVEAGRLDVLCALLPALDRAFACEPDEIEAAFMPRDVLRGTRVLARCGETVVSGEVTEVRPFDGLALRTDDGAARWLPAAATTILERNAETTIRHPS